MKYVELEGKNEITAKSDFVNCNSVDCEACGITCTWEDINIVGKWGDNNYLVCDHCNDELK